LEFEVNDELATSTNLLEPILMCCDEPRFQKNINGGWLAGEGEFSDVVHLERERERERRERREREREPAPESVTQPADNRPV
jgi:hypothetical protein